MTSSLARMLLNVNYDGDVTVVTTEASTATLRLKLKSGSYWPNAGGTVIGQGNPFRIKFAPESGAQLELLTAPGTWEVVL